MPASRHIWIRAPHRLGRLAARTGLALPDVVAVASAHRRMRGPYTAIGSVLRELVPDALRHCPELVSRHDIELLSTAPELRATVPATHETLTSLAVPKERTRFYSRLRTLRIAHGVVEFLRDYVASLDDGPRALVFDDAHEADPTDCEFLAVLLRRCDPALLTVVVSTAVTALPDHLGPVTEGLDAALTTYCDPFDGDDGGETDHGQSADLARSYVAGDCTSDDPRQIAAYEALDPAARATLHDARADELDELAEPSLRLGAIPWHAERGTDAGGRGIPALRYALDYCMDHGYYHAVIDFGLRGRALTDVESSSDHWWAFTTKMTTSYAVLGLPERSLALYDEVRAATTSATFHMQAAYATAMLYTRHLDPDRRDHTRARAWANQAIAFATQLSDPADREFQTAFNRNGLALVEVHRGDLPAALRLVDSCIEALDATLSPGEHALHRSVLRYNRAQVYAGLGRACDALAEYDAVIELDPNYAEYHFDRGGVLRRMGRDEQALAEYEQAIRLSPPFPEAFYNRGDTRAALGDVEGAVHDFGYVIELDPAYVDAYVNRASLRSELGDDTGAWQDVVAGLALQPANPHLLCLKGQLLGQAGESEQALQALDEAVEADRGLALAWAARGMLAYGQGDLTAAISDLEEATRLGSDLGVQFNLAVAWADAGRYAEALAAFDDVLASGEDPMARYHRARCLLQLGRRDEARHDVEACLAADPSLDDQVRQHLPDLVPGDRARPSDAMAR
jgi:tetratricopeptide (TPR) repeat protein